MFDPNSKKEDSNFSQKIGEVQGIRASYRLDEKTFSHGSNLIGPISKHCYLKTTMAPGWILVVDFLPATT